MANAKPAKDTSKTPAKGKKNKYEPGETFVETQSTKKDKDGNPIVRQIKITNR